MTEVPPLYHNVRDFGAVGNGETPDTAAIRAAIAACQEAGGGTVFFPVGTYLCGSLHLVDHLTLHLGPGAVLREEYLDDIESCRVGLGNVRPHFIMAHGVSNVSIVGQGSILGRGETEHAGRDRETRGFRTGLLYFEKCEQVHLSDFTIRFGDAWTVHFSRCENVFIQGVSILNHTRRCGGNDGLDLNSCRNVHVTNCRISAWDDCVVLKTKDLETEDDAVVFPCENIVVSNCTFETGCTAMKLGSESKGAFRDIHFSNCVVRRSSVGCGIYLLDGGTAERITFTQISMEIVDDNRYRPHMEPKNIHIFPVCIFLGKRTPESPLGRIRDVVLRDLQIESNYGIVMEGFDGRALENIVMENVTFRSDRTLEVVPRVLPCSRGRIEADCGNRGPARFNLSGVKDLRLRDVAVYLSGEALDAGEREVFSLKDDTGTILERCAARPAG